MLHKRCDIKTLLDETIRRERRLRDVEGADTVAHNQRIDVLQEIRDNIFDQTLPEDDQ